MLSGSTRRLTCLALLLTALVLSPAVLAKPPAPSRDAPESTGGQEITDLATEPTGRFTTAVVLYDSASRAINSGGLLPTGGGGTTQKDFYKCDFGPASQPRAGSGCRGINHAGSTAGTNPRQAVDMVSFVGSGGLVTYAAIAGPGDRLSLWTVSSDAPRFAKALEDPVVNASVSPDGSRVVAAVAPSTGGGRILVYDIQGALQWEYNLTDSQGNAAKPTSLAFSRDGRLLAVGTTRGVLFFDPQGPKPTRLTELAPLDTTGAVVKVVLSQSATAALVGTTGGLYYVPLVNARPAASGAWNRGVTEGVTDVAMTLDGKRFAAAAGSRIHFYRAVEGILIAEQLAHSHDAGAPVADIAYDAQGKLLVAVAGENVIALGPDRAAPLWSFRATDPARGGLDAPLRKVTLSDGGERIVVAGRTKFMAYTNALSATAAFGQGAPPTVVPATPLQVSFTLTNTGSLPDNYTLIVRRPVAWTGANPDNVALDPDASAVVNLTVEAPAGTAPGLYPLQVDVRSQATGGVIAAAAINLSIPRAVVLSIEPEDETVLLEPSDREKAVSLTLRNSGNAEGIVNLSVTQALSSGPSWPVRFSEAQVRVPAGGETGVRLIVSAPGDAPSGARNTLTVRAREGDVEATRVVTAYVDADFGAELLAANSSLELRPGESRALAVTLRNTGNTEDTFNVTYTISPSLAEGDWRITLAEDLKVTLGQGGSRVLSVGIRPAVAEPRDATLTLRAISQSDPGNAETTTDVLLTAAPAEPTPDEEERLLPAPSPLALLAGAGVALLALRRRGGIRR